MPKPMYPLLFALLLPATAAIAQQKMDDMKGMDRGAKPAAGAQATHTTKGTVKKLDAKGGAVTFAHEPVKSLNWPPMTMTFKVRDRAVLDKLAEGKAVEFDFVQAGNDYVVTAVR